MIYRVVIKSSYEPSVFRGQIRKKGRHFIILNKYSPISIHNRAYNRLGQKSFKNFQSLFCQWSFKKKCFCDLLTFKKASPPIFLTFRRSCFSEEWVIAAKIMSSLQLLLKNPSLKSSQNFKRVQQRLLHLHGIAPKTTARVKN